MKWLRYITISLLSFGFGIIFAYLIQGYPIFVTIFQFVASGISLGLVIEGIEMLREIMKERKDEKIRIHDILEAKSKKHSNDLATVFKEWQNSTWDLNGNYLFPCACEHLDEGYHDLWDIWFSEVNGKEGYKLLSVKCIEQKEKIKKQIENKIRNEIEVGFKYTFADEELNMLVCDIYDYIEHKISIRKELFFFKATWGRDMIPSIRSQTKETRASYRAFNYLTKSLKVFGDTKEIDKAMNYLEKIAEILNLMLIDHDLSESMKTLEMYQAKQKEKLKKFREGLDVIINVSKYGFKDIDGKCQICRSWKP